MIQPQDLVPGRDGETSMQPEKIVTPQDSTTEAREGQMACDNQELESNMQKIGGLLKKMHEAAIDKCEDIRTVSAFKFLFKNNKSYFYLFLLIEIEGCGFGYWKTQ